MSNPAPAGAKVSTTSDIYPSLCYEDAPAAIAWLCRAFGFTERLVVSGLSTFLGFALLGWLARQDWFYIALGIQRPSNAAALLLFMLVVPAFTWVLTPLAAAWSRRHEFQADAFAALHSDGDELARALVSLYRDNATTLTPDPLHSAFYDSHPPAIARIARLQKA